MKISVLQSAIVGDNRAVVRLLREVVGGYCKEG